MNEETKRVEDSFESGYLWELYMDLERQFENFLEYVPYIDGNESVHSFKLLNLITSIGGYVDSAFKEMARYPRFSDNKDCQRLSEGSQNRKRILRRICLQTILASGSACKRSKKSTDSLQGDWCSRNSKGGRSLLLSNRAILRLRLLSGGTFTMD